MGENTHVVIFTFLLNVVELFLQTFAFTMYSTGLQNRLDIINKEEKIPIKSVLLSGVLSSIYRIVATGLRSHYGSINTYISAPFLTVVISQYGGMIVMTLERFFAIYLHLRFETSWFRRNRNRILGVAWVFAFVVSLMALALIWAGVSEKNIVMFETSMIILGNFVTNVTFIAAYTYIYRAFRKANNQTKTTLFRTQKRKIFTPFFIVLSFLLFGTLPQFFDALVPTFLHRMTWLALDGICNALIYLLGNRITRKNIKSKFGFCCCCCYGHNVVEDAKTSVTNATTPSTNATTSATITKTPSTSS